MRKPRTIALICFFTALTVGVASAEVYREEFLTGKDWRERMTLRQKYMSLILPTALFKRFHVPMRRPIEEYIPTIDRVIDNNPYIETEDIASVYASTVFATEPESRPALAALERTLRSQTEYQMEGFSPRLIAESDMPEDALEPRQDD